MYRRLLRRPCLSLLIVAGLSPLACATHDAHAPQPAEIGRDVVVEGGVSFVLPAAYHEVSAATGRTFRLRGGVKPSYSTVHVQRRATGQAMGLDETFSLLLAELGLQESFDLTSLELHFAGDALTLVYAARFTLLDVPRRQWGALVDGQDGITAVLMTAPVDSFNEVSLDFFGVLQSLHHATPAPVASAAVAPAPQ